MCVAWGGRGAGAGVGVGGAGEMWVCGGEVEVGLCKILFHFKALLHNYNISFANTPFIVQYIAQYYWLLHPSPPSAQF